MASGAEAALEEARELYCCRPDPPRSVSADLGPVHAQVYNHYFVGLPCIVGNRRSMPQAAPLPTTPATSIGHWLLAIEENPALPPQGLSRPMWLASSRCVCWWVVCLASRLIVTTHMDYTTQLSLCTHRMSLRDTSHLHGSEHEQDGAGLSRLGSIASECPESVVWCGSLGDIHTKTPINARAIIEHNRIAGRACVAQQWALLRARESTVRAPMHCTHAPLECVRLIGCCALE
jgi:hypothetical protein